MVNLHIMKKFTRFFVVAAMAVAAVQAVPVMADDSIEAVERQPESSAAVVDGGMRLSASSVTAFEIYSITGQRVKSVTVDGESVTVELPRGCYIVRTPSWSKKFIVNK